MCLVCIAEETLKAGLRGTNIKWSDAPEGARTVVMRAQGENAEFKPAKYQIAIFGVGWPKEWEETGDLAGVVGRYGFDVRWKRVPAAVQRWVMGEGTMPSFWDLNPGISRL